MSNLATKVKEARASLLPLEWSSARNEAVRRRIHGKRQRFTLSTVALGSAALAVAVAVAIIWFAQGGSAGLAPELALVDRPELRPSAQIELRDGTRAVQLGSGSQLRLLLETDELVSFSLESGKGWFEVTPSDKRKVEVQIQDVRIEVEGTEFVVEISGELVHVWVQRGHVVVTSDGKKVTVTTGEDREFPAHNKSKETPPRIPDKELEIEPKPNPVSLPKPPPLPKKEETPRDPEEEVTQDKPLPAKTTADTSEAEHAGKVDPDRISQLWKQADQGRLTGNNDQAISALTELLGKHDDDPRAALAAFTLGRVLIDAHKSPVVAARAFAKARKLAPAGPLVEDALLREIEAWFEAGDSRRVMKRSEKYFKLFPKGRYLKQVHDLGEAP